MTTEKTISYRFGNIIVVLLVICVFIFLFFNFCSNNNETEFLRQKTVLQEDLNRIRDDLNFERKKNDTLQSIIADPLKSPEVIKAGEKLNTVLTALDDELSDISLTIKRDTFKLSNIESTKKLVEAISRRFDIIKVETEKTVQKTLLKFVQTNSSELKKLKTLNVNLAKQVKDLKLIISKKDDQIKILQADNKILKETIVKIRDSSDVEFADLNRRLSENDSILGAAIDSSTLLQQRINQDSLTIKGLEKDINNRKKVINTIAKGSFKALYRYKEDKKKELVTELDNSHRHRRRHVKNIEISFMVSDEIVQTDKATIVKLELFNAEDELVAPKSYTQEITIKDYQGNLTLPVKNGDLAKGEYYFKLSYRGDEILTYKFRIS